jgi:exopolysaccharide biosynthesis polyprenyl glycosylphosphotransferase
VELPEAEPRRVGAGVRPPRVLKLVLPTVDALALVVALGLLGNVNTTLAVVYAVSAILALNGVPRARINPRLSGDAGWILSRLAIPLFILSLAGAWEVPVRDIARVGVIAVSAVFLGRGLAYALIRIARARGVIVEPTLIVGAGPIGVQVADTLARHPEFGLAPVGFLDVADGRELPLPVLGEAAELQTLVHDHDVRRVIVAFGSTREPDLVGILRTCDQLPVEVHLVPRFFELGVGPEGPEAEDLWGLPIVRLNRAAARRTGLRLKRAFDLVMGSILLLLTSPLMLATAIAVRTSSHGPILFRQKRVGRQGKVFELLKFRTMSVNPDSDTQWSVVSDVRITPVGSILRRTCLDELPQLFNVLRGDMSLVGPRPERPHFVDQFSSSIPRYVDRHRVPAGLTGWAQVHGLRGAGTSIPERIQLDNYYIEHWSLWRDLVILARTIRQIFSGQGW